MLGVTKSRKHYCVILKNTAVQKDPFNNLPPNNISIKQNKNLMLKFSQQLLSFIFFFLNGRDVYKTPSFHSF